MTPIILSGPQNLTNKIVTKVYNRISSKKTVLINALGTQIMPDIFFKTASLVSYDIVCFINFSENHIRDDLFSAFTEKLFLVASGPQQQKINMPHAKIMEVKNFSEFPKVEQNHIINYYRDLILSHINLAYLPFVLNPDDAKDIKLMYYNDIKEKLKFIDVTYETYSVNQD